MHQLTPCEIVAIAVTVVGSITDIKYGKIYNWLTFPASGLGLGLNWFLSGTQGAIQSLEGFGIGTAVGLLLSSKWKYKSQPIAFGDVKLMGALGALIGPKYFLLALFYFALVYGVVAIALILKAVKRSHLLGFFKLFSSADVDLSATVDMTEVDQARKRGISLGPIILVGLLLGLFLDKPTLLFLGFN